MSMLSVLRQPSLWDRLAQALVPLVLVVWLAWMLAESVLLWWQGPTPAAIGDLPVLRQQSAASSAPVLSEAQARRWELFGPVEVQTTRQDPREAPETRLKLELLGVFQHPDPKVATAIIAEQNRDAALFRPGDRLPGNATLEEVYADQVILNRMGQREALKLKEGNLSGIDVQDEQPRQRYNNRTDARQDRGWARQDKSGPDLADQRNMIIDRMGLSPHGAGGYVISDGAPEEVLATVGLRPGDVILSVNGITLGEEGADVQALEDFRNTGVATIVVERGDQRFTVTYPP